MTKYEEAKTALRVLFDAVPKGKFQTVMAEATALEIAFNAMASTLTMLRTYFLDTTGEDSPFVKKIDTLIPRKS